MNAVKIIDTLLGLIPQNMLTGELKTHIAVLKRKADVIEDVGSYERGQIVHFNPDAKNVIQIRAKVLRCHGTSNGKVFYELALSFVDGQGVETFAETVPIRDVSPSYVRGISADDEAAAQNRTIQHLDIGNSYPTEAASAIKNMMEGSASDATFALPPN